MGNATLAATIKTMRLSRGMSQQDLADEVGVSRSAVGMWESGVREPNLDTIEALADVFNVPLYSLVDANAAPDAEQGQADPIYISLPSGNQSTDELRRQLHTIIDQLGDADVQLLISIAERLCRSERAANMPRTDVVFNPATGQKLPLYDIACDGSVETKHAAKMELSEMTEDQTVPV